MILATMGSILTSLLPHATAKSSTLDPINALGLRNKHVRILSLTSTIARLATGLSADYLAPSLVAVPNPRYNPDDADDDMPQHLYVRKRKVRLTRGAFVAICSFVLAAVFAWSAGMLSSESGLWVLSGGVGSLYGALFTLTVSLTTSSNILFRHRLGARSTDHPFSPLSCLLTLDRQISAWLGV